jgi:hypothetical protein
MQSFPERLKPGIVAAWDVTGEHRHLSDTGKDLGWGLGKAGIEYRRFGGRTGSAIGVVLAGLRVSPLRPRKKREDFGRDDKVGAGGGERLGFCGPPLIA